MREALHETLQIEDDWLWLCSIQGLYDTQKKALLSYFGSPGAVQRAARDDFRYFEKIGLTWIGAVYPALAEGYLERIKTVLKEKQIRFVSRDKPGYPARLRQIPDSPYGLFYKGRLPEDPERMQASAGRLSVGIVGARLCSPRGEYFAKRLGELLAQAGADVVSGMASGIDGTAQLAAIRSGGYSAGVLGCGADICYPAANIGLYRLLSEKGCLVSELAPGSSPRRIHFPLRNRIISGLCDALVVVEAREKSGSLLTAGYALDQGREVFAVESPQGDALGKGCADLIRDGAAPVREPEDILALLAERLPEYTPTSKTNGIETCKQTGRAPHKPDGRELALAPPDELVYSYLDLSPVSQQQLLQLIPLSAPQIAQSLITLQLMGLAAETGKNKFIRVQ